MIEDEEVLKDFLIEGFEALDRIDLELVELEQNPGSVDLLNSIFRSVHTIKGTCGFLDLSILESITHRGETLLDDMRTGAISNSSRITTVLLRLGDAMRAIMTTLQDQGNEGTETYEALARELEEARTVSAEPSPETSLEEEFRRIVEEHEAEQKKKLAGATPSTTAEAAAEEEPEQQRHEPEPALKVEATPAPQVQAAKVADEHDDSTRATAGNKDESKSQDTTIRVDVELLDKLMNLVGELVLARNQIIQFTKSHTDAAFGNTSQRLNLITSELQEGVMRTRMQPISTIWKKFPRIVRDLSKACGKNVRLVMEGEETDLDKTIIEAIKDPLTHIVRNSVDHGIEPPDKRSAAGKDPEGVLSLKAYHEGGHVVIEIADDGAGLRTERIREKAIEKGLLTPAQARDLSDQQANMLIFAAGFSTAEAVTNISGRGVGMDVVRSNIESIGGAIDLSSTFGKGTLLRIKIPLTLAIVPALMIASGGERFAIPQVSLVELIRVDGSRLVDEIEEIDGTNFYRLRGALLPLVYLAQALKLNPKCREEEQSPAINIVVIRADEQQFGLVVDEIYDTEEIVVKPMGRMLKENLVFAGATILGDGHIALIIDVAGLGRYSAILDGTGRPPEPVAENNGQPVGARTSMVIVTVDAHRRVALPLDKVHRLEKFNTNTLEHTGQELVVQYREGILPLLNLHSVLGHAGIKSGDSTNVVVVESQNGLLGLVVNEIVDIVDEYIDLQQGTKGRGIEGCAVIRGKVTDVLDLDHIAPR